MFILLTIIHLVVSHIKKVDVASNRRYAYTENVKADFLAEQSKVRTLLLQLEVHVGKIAKKWGIS